MQSVREVRKSVPAAVSLSEDVSVAISVVEESGAGGVLNLEGKCVLNPELSEVFVKKILEALHENCDP